MTYLLIVKTDKYFKRFEFTKNTHNSLVAGNSFRMEVVSRKLMRTTFYYTPPQFTQCHLCFETITDRLEYSYPDEQSKVKVIFERVHLCKECEKIVFGMYNMAQCYFDGIKTPKHPDEYVKYKDPLRNKKYVTNLIMRCYVFDCLPMEIKKKILFYFI